MREILFRGKDFSGVINHNWCFGSLDTIEDDRAIIIYSDRFGNKCRIFVDPSTVGEYTGLKDKNGERIFEGDILRQAYHPEEDVIIEWHDGRFKFRKRNKPKDYGYESLCCVQNTVDYLKVIGNIHDNPELLGGGNNGW